VARLRFSHDSQRLVATKIDGSISVWETATGKLVDVFDGGESPFLYAMFLADGDHVLASNTSGIVQILNIAMGNRARQGVDGNVGQFGMAILDVASTGKLAAWGDAVNHRIVVWDLENQQKRFEINNPSVITHLRFSPDGTALAVAGRENIVRVYDLRNGRELHRIDVGRFVEPGSRC
jgi:WD40 repeat protein